MLSCSFSLLWMNSTFIYVCCLFSSLPQCTVDNTIFLLVLLSSQHIHNGTTLLGNLGYHIPPSHRKIPDYKCNIEVHSGRKSNQPDYLNQIRALLLSAGRFPVQQLMMKNMTTRKKKRRRMMTAGLKTYCYFCSSDRCVSQRLTNWCSVLMLSWVLKTMNSQLLPWALRILFPTENHYS